MNDREILRAEGLVKEFESGGKNLRVLDGVSLSLGANEILAVTGPSGSGKSTLLSLLAGLDRPTRGSVFLDSRDINALPEKEISRIWRQEIGFVFQSYYLLPTLTALENVRVPLELDGDRDSEKHAAHWLKAVGLSHRAAHLPAEMSGGEQQRTALARAMVNKPRILFADEPTGNLDSKTGRVMEDLLLSLARDHHTSLMLVTHESSFAKKADRVIRLEGGRIK